MGVIIFNGQSLQDFGGVVEHPPEYEIPERNYDIISIPGRNGDLTIDKGSYKNVKRSYEIAFGAINGDYTVMANQISNWLNSAFGYVRLEDSYEPDYYKLAMYSEEVSIKNILQQAGRATINFNRKPQRFLKSGDTKLTLPTSATINNPTIYTSLPIINVMGNGNGILQVGEYVVEINNIVNYITINSEIEDAYKDLTNLNPNVTLHDGFPELVPGSNNISFSGGITSVEVVPKWWTI